MVNALRRQIPGVLEQVCEKYIGWDYSSDVSPM